MSTLLEDALQLVKSGKLHDAIKTVDLILQRDDNCTDAHYLRGIAYTHLNSSAEAISSLQKAAILKPDSIRYTVQLAKAHRKTGNSNKAHQILLDLKDRVTPDFELYNELGDSFRFENDIASASFHYGKAVDLDSANFAALVNYATSLKLLERFKEAAYYFKEALKFNSNISQLFYNTAVCLAEIDQLPEALKHLKKALVLEPENSDFLYMIGKLLFNMFELSTAVTFLKQTLKIKSDHKEAVGLLTEALSLMTDHDEADKVFKTIISQCKDPLTYSNYLFAMNHNPAFTDKEIFEAHAEWYSLFGKQIVPFTKWNNTKDRDKRLRIGYVSADLCNHPVAFFMEPILKNHNKENFDIFIYDNSPRPDENTKKLQTIIPEWRSVCKLTDESLATYVQEDEIDILVDLSGHTASNRLGLFCRKVAPVQVTYLGYPNTTGLPTIDYRLTDPIADPLDRESFYSEKLLRLSKSFLVYSPMTYAPEPSEPPSLKNGYITFGSFNRLSKLNPLILNTWIRILQKVPNSHLLLKAGSFNDAATKEKLISIFKTNGIGIERLDFRSGTKTQKEHLALYSQIDISLDTFPYNGTTTTFEALWMGIPVICYCGTMHAGRVGASILENLKLTDLIGYSIDEYVEKSVKISGDSQRIAFLHSNLREMMYQSNLCNGKVFTEDLEKVYRVMWGKFCSSEY